jgi:spore germination cell wall hydrolase CwlJ-like protein
VYAQAATKGEGPSTWSLANVDGRWSSGTTKESIPGGMFKGSASNASTPAGCISPVCYPTLSSDDRDALGRVAYAEAGNQGTEGLAAVLYAILNRLASGRFGSSVEAVIEAPGQFEPVDRAGGRWRNLPTLSTSHVATVATILGLIQQGRLPDPTHGATFFQNPQIVASRAAAGQVPIALTNFNNQTPIAVIGDHAFFRQLRPDSLPCKGGSPGGHLVYPPDLTPTFRVERRDAGTPGQPCAVIYRIIPITKTTAEATR